MRHMETNTDTSTPVARVRASFANAYRASDGTREGDPDSAIIPWDDGYIVVTQLAEAARYDVGIYAADEWDHGCGVPSVLAMVPVAELEQVIDFLTEEHEAGVTSFAAWATHWFTDISDFDLVEG